MSHFLLTLITDERPTPELMKEKLLPFHEFECTGEDNEYVQDLDETLQHRQEFAMAEFRRVRLPDGALADPDSDQFFREPTVDEAVLLAADPHNLGEAQALRSWNKDWGDGQGIRRKIFFLPEGCTEVTVLGESGMSFTEFVTGYNGIPRLEAGQEPDLAGDHKFGYAEVTAEGEVVKVIRRTNPNDKWDWWQLGGRYTGRLTHIDAVPDNAGLLRGEAPSAYGENECDSCKRGWLDLERMRASKKNARRRYLNEAIARLEEKAQLTVEEITKIWADYVNAGGWKKLVEDADAANALPHNFLKTLPHDHPIRFAFESGVRETIGEGFFGAGCSEAFADPNDWVENVPAFTTYALLMDGEWHANGEMGWFGLTSGETLTPEQWEEKVTELVTNLPEDKWITMIDCHI